MTLFDPDRPPAPPRPAATVVLLREAPGGEPEVFMLRRSAKSPFMPDALVFPGGAVDPLPTCERDRDHHGVAEVHEEVDPEGVAERGRVTERDDHEGPEADVTHAEEPRHQARRGVVVRLGKPEHP
jgi:hypothetical protein